MIGRRARRVSPENALDVVAGWIIVNDLALRERIFRTDIPALGADWLAAKNSPTFLPTGPVLVPRATLADLGDLWLTLRLNGEVMQDESTKDMIFDVARLVAYCSTVATVPPGDLVLTGSPAGNGLPRGRLLRAGDVLDSTITGAVRRAAAQGPGQAPRPRLLRRVDARGRRHAGRTPRPIRCAAGQRARRPADCGRRPRFPFLRPSCAAWTSICVEPAGCCAPAPG